MKPFKRRYLPAFVAGLAAFAPASPAYSYSANVFYEMCQTPGQEDGCTGMAFGLISSAMWHNLDRQEGIPQFCLPQGAQTTQAIDLVLKFNADNPQHRHLPAAAMTLVALVDAFPC